MEQWKSKISTLATTAVLTLAPFAAFAADEPAGRYSSVDTTWVLIGAFLVFFMQPGFAMVETGLTRAKNAGNIVMKNFMDFALGSIVFWIIGFGLMFGEDVNGIIGMPDFFVQNFQVADDAGYPPMAYLIFQTVFCATSATIVSGAMAERTKFSAYCIYSIAISLFIYPISGHWAWGGGWLATMGFHDFAGSTVVHMVGGICAFVGALMLGPRIGKYNKDGSVNAIPGHSLTLAALGMFILWFGWFGFNGASTVSISGDKNILAASMIYVTTNMAAAVGAVTVMCLTWIRYGKPDVSMTLNGGLAGLVAITAGCDAVSVPGAFVIGLLAGITIVFAIEGIDKVLKVDDPVGAIGAHGVCGALGTILTGFLSVSDGLLYTGDPSFLITQIIGVAAIAAYVAVVITILFKVMKATMGLRVSPEEEEAGLDFEEHGLASAYADFMPMPEHFAQAAEEAVEVATEPTAPVPSVTPDGKPITCVTIVTSNKRFEPLKVALEAIGITGMTVTRVLGYGLQKGNVEMYRGSVVSSKLLPQLRVDIVVSKIPSQTIINVAKKILYTGNYGDGKIFISPISNVIKIRTGEEGFDALQDKPIA
ncbi:MAG: ammonium transporter [Megasphaera sp.]|nr:ammonium transporter [Megasphaera sp.]MCI1248359.1 ammonium transporter [Megasphaera sp.]